MRASCRSDTTSQKEYPADLFLNFLKNPAAIYSNLKPNK